MTPNIIVMKPNISFHTQQAAYWSREAERQYLDVQYFLRIGETRHAAWIQGRAREAATTSIAYRLVALELESNPC